MSYSWCLAGCSKSGEEFINDDIKESEMKSISSFKSENSYFIATWTWYSQYYMVSLVYSSLTHCLAGIKFSCLETALSNSINFVYFDASNLQTIPKFVAIEKDLISKKRAMLLDPSGSPWPVRLDLVAEGFLNMTSGWPDFCRGNKVGAGDTFIFEFVTQTVLQVHIFRAGAKKEAQCLGVDE